MSVRLLRCHSDIYSFTIQTLSPPYYCLSSTFFFHLSSCFCSSLVPLVFPLVILCTYERQTPAFGSHSNRGSSVLCVCVGAKEQRGDLRHYLYSFKLHQATYRPFFYDCNMRYLTYHCHKVQQTQGSGELAHTDRHTYVTEESRRWSWRQMYV